MRYAWTLLLLGRRCMIHVANIWISFLLYHNSSIYGPYLQLCHLNDISKDNVSDVFIEASSKSDMAGNYKWDTQMRFLLNPNCGKKKIMKKWGLNSNYTGLSPQRECWFYTTISFYNWRTLRANNTLISSRLLRAYPNKNWCSIFREFFKFWDKREIN